MAPGPGSRFSSGCSLWFSGQTWPSHHTCGGDRGDCPCESTYSSTPSLFPFTSVGLLAGRGQRQNPPVCRCCCFPRLLSSYISLPSILPRVFHTPSTSHSPPPLSPALSLSLSPLLGEIFTSPSLCLSTAHPRLFHASYSSPYFCLYLPPPVIFSFS